MPRYADHECADCGVVLPSNELYRVQDRTLSSVSQSKRLYRGTRGGIGVGGTSRQTFKIQQLEVCPDCKQYRDDRARRAAFWRFVGWLLVLGVGAAIVIGVANAPKNKSSEIVANDAARLPVENTPTASSALEPSSSEPAAVETPSATESPEAAEPIAQPQTEAPQPGETMIADATVKALNSGHAEPWKARGDHGFVTVSSAQAYGDRTCRNAYSTIITHGEETRSRNAMWCQPNGGGEWTPSP